MLSGEARGRSGVRPALSRVWTSALLWVGYLGYSLTAHFGAGGQSPHAKEGGWIGLAGSLVIAAASVAALRPTPTAADEVGVGLVAPQAHSYSCLTIWIPPRGVAFRL